MRHLKIVLCLAVALSAAAAFAQATATAPPSSDELMKSATAKAVKESKSVWVIFHASW
ncbi:MAG: hypothetical protein IH944_11565 [Armatimonadetes bacterium]|nr:hypothetical protein [Armatimonadota bacterium]